MVKGVIKERVPAYVQETPEFSVFLKWVSQKKLKTRDQVKKKIDEEIKDCQEKLKKVMSDNRPQGTNRRIVALCTRKLKFLRLARNKIVKYL